MAEKEQLHVKKLSGTKFRQMLRAGEEIPEVRARPRWLPLAPCSLPIQDAPGWLPSAPLTPSPRSRLRALQWFAFRSVVEVLRQHTAAQQQA